MATRGFLLVDANVLVDYQEADLGILALVSRRLGTVHIVSTVLREVDLDEHDCARLGIRVVEPTIAQLIAATPSNGRLSLPDRLCLEVCREHAWTGVSNDKALRRACEAGGVAVRWGLELMLELVRAGHLAKRGCRRRGGADACRQPALPRRRDLGILPKQARQAGAVARGLAPGGEAGRGDVTAPRAGRGALATITCGRQRLLDPDDMGQLRPRGSTRGGAGGPWLV
jgi:predicted nucleic acid-binding protein